MPPLKDLTGQRFGKAVVIKRVDEKNLAKKPNVAKWLCLCDCGNSFETVSRNLLIGKTKSCGCLQKEIVTNNISKTGNNALGIYDRTNITAIKSATIGKNNKSGIKGVSWDKSTNLWRADLKIQGKQHRLGRFKKLEDAAKARKLAEELYFEPIIEKYKKETGA